MMMETNRVLVITGARARVAQCADCKANLMLLVTERTRRLAWCMSCSTELTMIECGETPDSLRIASYIIKQWVDGGATQFIKTAEGATIIILLSLPNATESVRKESTLFRSPRRLSLDVIDPTCPPRQLALITSSLKA
jgi:hypothetical protein